MGTSRRNLFEYRTGSLAPLARGFLFALALPKIFCELFFQYAKLVDLVANGGDFGLQQTAHVGAGRALRPLKDRQFANFRERKPELPGAPDELNPLNVSRVEQAKATCGSRRAVHEALLFVEPDSIDAQTGLFGHSSNPDADIGHTLSGYTLESSPESGGIPQARICRLRSVNCSG